MEPPLSSPTLISISKTDVCSPVYSDKEAAMPSAKVLEGSSEEAHVQSSSGYLHGARLLTVTLLNATVLFLVQIEIFIVTTSLVAITKELGDFDRASWVLASYLLGYVSFVVIVAKLSDIFGRKPVYVLSLLMFTIFSGGCAAAQSMTQLIILRAFQGLGGGASYALATILTIEIVPPDQNPTQMAYMGIAVMLALLLGPIAGGGISSVTTWRWIFLFNVPVGAVALVLAIFGIPAGFPHYNNRETASRQTLVPPRARPLDRLDVPGCVLLLLATLSIVSAFQEAGSRFAWDSAYFIALAVIFGVLWLALVIWERRVTLVNTSREPVLPWRFLTSRLMVGTLLGIILQGGPLTVTNLQLPQRFQLISGLSSLDAGVRLIPFGLGLSAGTITSAILAKRAKVPAIYYVIFGALLQIVGYALLATSGTYVNIPPVVYVYQVIVGLGCGISYQTLVLNIPVVAEKRDHAVAMGAANQFRAIGSTIVVAVTTAIFNGYVSPRLSALGIPDPNRIIERHATAIPPEMWNEARDVLSRGYNLQMFVLVGCGAAQAVVALLLWKKKNLLVTNKGADLGGSPTTDYSAGAVSTKTGADITREKDMVASSSV